MKRTRLRNLLLGLSLLVPGTLSAATFVFQPSSGDFATSTNWNPNATFSAVASDQYRITNSDTASLASSVNVAASDVRLGDGAGLTGGLTVNSGGNLSYNIMRIAQGSGSVGNVTINSGGQISGATNVGANGTGTLTIESGGIFDGGGVSDLRYGISSTASSSSIINRGSISNGNALLPSSGTFINDGGTTFFDNSISFAAATFATAEIRMLGSLGSFTANRITNPTSNALFRFDFDGSGITPINITNDATITGTSLELDLDAVGVGGTYTLLDAGTTVTGTFDNVTFLGSLTGIINYNADSVTVTVVPEPTSMGLLGLSGCALLLWRRRSRRL